MPRPVSTTTTLGAIRAKLGLSAAQLSKRAGVGLSTIQKIERGRHPLTKELARKISSVTGVNSSWLLYGKPTDPPKGAGDRALDPERAHKAYLRKSKPLADLDPLTRHFFDELLAQKREIFDVVIGLAAEKGRAFQALDDLEIAFREILERYRPDLNGKVFRPLVMTDDERAAYQKENFEAIKAAKLKAVPLIRAMKAAEKRKSAAGPISE